MHMNKLHTFKSYIFLKHIQYLLTTTYVFKDLAFFHISGYKVHLLPVQQLLQAPQVKTCKYFQSQLSSPIGGFFFNKCPWHRRALEASNLRLCNTTTFSFRSFAESCHKIKRDASQRQWELQKDWNPMMTKWKTIWPHALQHLHKKRVKVGRLVGSREPELRQLHIRNTIEYIVGQNVHRAACSRAANDPNKWLQCLSRRRPMTSQ